MPSFQNAFSLLQKIGKCMMLPVSVLPVAGILLGVGSANFTWLPEIVSQVMAASGNAIFANLPLLFAIGVAIGLTDNDGVSALAGTVGFVVFLAAMGVCAKLRGIETATIMGIPSIETFVRNGSFAPPLPCPRCVRLHPGCRPSATSAGSTSGVGPLGRTELN